MFDFVSWRREAASIANQRNARVVRLLNSLSPEKQKEVKDKMDFCQVNCIEYNLADLVESSLL